MGKLLNCLKLNWRMLGHALHHRWLGPIDYAAGYDRLAADYDANWLNRLRPVTDRLLALTPPEASRILDLGCGTGYTTGALERRYPGAELTAVDLSAGMLAEARKRGISARLVQADLLTYLMATPPASCDLIVSAWALGYSRSSRVIRACARALRPGGTLLFVVNLRDTLPAVFYAYRRTLARFPRRAAKALWPRFPASAAELAGDLRRSGMAITFSEEGEISAQPPECGRLSWLLRTGILAGFDQVLPLAEDPEVGAYFESELDRSARPFTHHYAMFRGVRHW